MTDPTPANGAYSGNGQNIANDITTVVKMITSNMDQIIQHEAKTNDMQAPSEFVQSLGRSGQIKLATLTTSGLGTYDKVKGYPVGQAALKWESYSLSYDRALKVTIDKRDEQASDGLVTAAATLAELTRSSVVPELDATRMAKLFSSLKAQNSANSNVVAEAKPTKANLVSDLIEAIDTVANNSGYDEGMTIYVNGELRSILDLSSEVTLMRNVTDGATGIGTVTRMIHGQTIKYVPPERMKTTVTLNDGYTSVYADDSDIPGSYDSTKYGFTGGSYDIWFAITTPGVANAVTVINDPKVIPADVNQQHDGDAIAYRIYHDLSVPKNKCKAAYMADKTGALS